MPSATEAAPREGSSGELAVIHWHLIAEILILIEQLCIQLLPLQLPLVLEHVRNSSEEYRCCGDSTFVGSRLW